MAYAEVIFWRRNAFGNFWPRSLLERQTLGPLYVSKVLRLNHFH